MKSTGASVPQFLAAIGVAMLLWAGGVLAKEVQTNELDALVRQFMPGCVWRTMPGGNSPALVSAGGELLALPLRTGEWLRVLPEGYYECTRAEEFLKRQDFTVRDAEAAVGVVRLLLALSFGMARANQKIYRAHAFEAGWVIEVDHDFKQFGGMVGAIMPFEIWVDDGHRLLDVRHRAYGFTCSPSAYTNRLGPVRKTWPKNP